MNQKPLERGDLALIFAFIGIPTSMFLYGHITHVVGILLNYWKSPESTIHIWIAGFTGSLLLIYQVSTRWNRHLDNVFNAVSKSKGTIYLGHSTSNESLHLTTDVRTRHTQVIGTTSCGKSESVILPWAIQDIQNGGGLIIVDGKADKSFLDKIYAYAVEAGRGSDFRLFSLSNPDESCSFNPLAVGTVQEVTERVFSSFQFNNEYFESVQFRLFRDIIAIIKEQSIVPTFAHVNLLLSNKDVLESWIEGCQNEPLKASLSAFNDLSARERDERSSGLASKLGHFCADEHSPLSRS